MNTTRGITRQFATISCSRKIKLSVSLACALSAFLLFGAGCASYSVLYDKNRKTVANVWEGHFIELRGFVPCNGGIRIYRKHGLFRSDFVCGIYFKTNVPPPGEFIFTMETDPQPKNTQSPEKIIEAKGVVKLIDKRHFSLDVEYKQGDGSWRKLALHGRQKIDTLWPDDIPPTSNQSL